MKMNILVVSCLVFAIVACDASESWLGEISIPDAPVLFQLAHDSHRETAGQLKTFAVNTKSVPVSTFSETKGHLQAEFKLGDETAVLDAIVDGDKAKGEVQIGEKKFPLVLQRVAPAPSADVKGRIFRSADGGLFWIGPFGEFGGDCYFLDFASGRFGLVFATPAGPLILGQSLIAPFFPVSATISEAKTANASKTTISILEDGKETKVADEVPLQRNDVSFQNGEVLLRGTVTRVASERRLPAIVLLHGSGPEDRDYLGPWIGFFAAQGYAVLAYDKRGVGESTGDWKQSGLEALAGDAIAAVRKLESLDDVDASRIGLVGLSQGGWIAPQVAAAVPETKFLILHGGPMLSVAEEDLAAFRGELEGYGFPEDEIAEAIKYRELDNQVTNGTAKFEVLQNRYRELKNKGVEWLLSEPASPNDWFRNFYRRIFPFDPAQFWRKISIPVLALYAERDRSVPLAENVACLKKFQAANPKLSAKVIVFPNANHLMLQCKTGVQREYPSLRAFEPKYFAELTDWLKRVDSATGTR